ncbi:gag/pol protein [Cucumis melo var. makuwa]|uniref:Gag/pol protein n=1 Tax=Cucumis melo var. makuwa TaxID=1194695 RepID=A0A5D3CU27_CUCMM|nr:gag/pol protein [Cucumis melo var. makuwa]TYK15447.1 gag/pol protein [Cucumis melo var. makuwa]
MDSLREMFGQPSWSLRHKAIKYIYTKQMKEGTFVKEHVLDMMMHFNIAEVNDDPINEANQNLTIGKWKEVEVNVTTIENDRHWLRNCPKYLAKKKVEKEAQGKYDLLAVETCLVEYDTST